MFYLPVLPKIHSIIQSKYLRIIEHLLCARHSGRAPSSGAMQLEEAGNETNPRIAIRDRTQESYQRNTQEINRDSGTVLQ